MDNKRVLLCAEAGMIVDLVGWRAALELGYKYGVKHISVEDYLDDGATVEASLARSLAAAIRGALDDIPAYTENVPVNNNILVFWSIPHRRRMLEQIIVCLESGRVIMRHADILERGGA